MTSIDPTDVRDDLEAISRGVEALRSPRPPSNEREGILTGISASYFRLRRGLGYCAIAFPVVLWLWSGSGSLQTSISAYYHFAPGPCVAPAGAGTARDVFVGVLCAIGTFLYFYRGYSRAENRALNLAGAAAAVIALFPMNWPTAAAAMRCRVPLPVAGTWRGDVHYAAAAVFFLAIAYVAIFRSGDTVKLLPLPRQAYFTMTYRILGGLMSAVPLTVFVSHLIWNDPESLYLLAIEVFGIWTFAAFWLVKSREIAAIERSPVP